VVVALGFTRSIVRMGPAYPLVDAHLMEKIPLCEVSPDAGFRAGRVRG
jgi:hypothetical protein